MKTTRELKEKFGLEVIDGISYVKTGDLDYPTEKLNGLRNGWFYVTVYIDGTYQDDLKIDFVDPQDELATHVIERNTCTCEVKIHKLRDPFDPMADKWYWQGEE